MMLKSVSFLVLFIGYINCATNFCVETTPCKCVLSAGRTIDLSRVGTVNKPRFYEVGGKNTTGLYSYNPCYEFGASDPLTVVEPENKPCIGAAACVRTPGSNSGDLPEEHIIGQQSTATFGSNDYYDLHINYSVPSPAKQKLTVKLVCSNETTENHKLTIEIPETDENKHIVLVLSSKCACANGCDSKDPTPETGLSTGSILLIVFFTIFLAYFVIGIVWNFCNGAHGLELVPNLDFWNELPKLIIEGVAFSCSCFGKQSSYGEV